MSLFDALLEDSEALEELDSDALIVDSALLLEDSSEADEVIEL